MNLIMINAAKEQVALEKGLKEGELVDPADVASFLREGRIPTCPDGGEYTIGPVGRPPECSKEMQGAEQDTP